MSYESILQCHKPNLDKITHNSIKKIMKTAKVASQYTALGDLFYSI